MKKLYISGNFIIADDNGAIKRVASGKSSYKEDGFNFIIKDEVQRATIIILIADASNWFDEAGVVAFSEATMRTFCLNEAGNFNSPGATSFEDLSDVPGYSGNGGSPLIINQSEDGVGVGSKQAKRYLFTIDQASTNAPTVNRTVMNETDLVWTWAYVNAAQYQISALVAIEKVFVICGSNSDALFKPTQYVDAFGTATITFQKSMIDGAVVADGLSNVSIEISISD